MEASAGHRSLLAGSRVKPSSTADRHGLEEAISQLRPGDVLVVWRLDRLGRSLRHLIETITGLHNIAGTSISLGQRCTDT